MWNFNSLLPLLLICLAAFAAAQRSGNRTILWQTLSGDEPLVIARGGFSGIFPDSSYNAYAFAQSVSTPSLVLWCDVQLTRDGVGICSPDVRLDNSSNIANIYPNGSNTYVINGVRMQGWFSIDYTSDGLRDVYLTQGVFSRSNEFDRSLLLIQLVEDVARQFRPPGFWLNVQHDSFYTLHNFSMRSYVIATSRSVVVNYISSPEVGFLRSLVSRFRPSPTKLIFRFLEQTAIEPSTNRTYGDLLRDLTFISTFASGIIVPKDYIWPVGASLYLSSYTSVVNDAHRQGLEIFASEFANDVPFAYNFSYNPVDEYLSFMDNGNFSVDGVLSDFPITPSAAIDCFAHLVENSRVRVNVTVISREGASGDYPGCTNLAYTNAISDGADVIDCPVQISQDGVPFCLGSINLIDRTTIATTNFSNLQITIPELNIVNGIFPFNLSWSDIQNLTPAITNPLRSSRLYRNPRMNNSGSLVSLADFLAMANDASTVTGVLISIENALYLAEYQGLDVIDAVLDALDTAGFNNRTAKHVMIQSTYSASLLKVKERNSNYELVYNVDENIRDVTNSTIMDIRNFANSVIISKDSVFPRNIGFLSGMTDVVSKFQSFGLPVYVQLFSNEFISQAWDFFSDAYIEINSFLNVGITGVITDFPGTAATYRRNRCLGLGDKTPIYMSPVGPGQLLQLIQPQPPAAAPSPILSEDDVVEPPLPPVVARSPPTNGSTAAAPSPPNGAQPRQTAAIFFCIVAAVFATLLMF